MGQPILEVEHLKKSYVNNVPILDDVSFSLQKGEVVVIVGPSGCGKSTFLRCINRLEEIDTGVLKLNGVSYEKEKKNISKVREKIGMVFQSYELVFWIRKIIIQGSFPVVRNSELPLYVPC